ncbi:hypothetical protein ACTG9Q_12950 [Actinokineospora sp. 24-640]
MSARMSPGTSTGVRHVALVAEVLFVGVLVSLASLPVVTSWGAAAAGAALLRELVDDGHTPTVRRFALLLGRALRDPVTWAVPLVVVAVAALDLLALLGGLPGATVLGPALGLALAALVAVSLRAAARWRPGARWAVLVAPGHWLGTVSLVAAVVVAGLVVVQAPAFAVVLPGLLVFAAVAVERGR